jgi:hypothetical protein
MNITAVQVATANNPKRIKIHGELRVTQFPFLFYDFEVSL